MGTGRYEQNFTKTVYEGTFDDKKVTGRMVTAEGTVTEGVFQLP